MQDSRDIKMSFTHWAQHLLREKAPLRDGAFSAHSGPIGMLEESEEVAKESSKTAE